MTNGCQCQKRVAMVRGVPASLRERKRIRTRDDLIRASAALLEANEFDNTTVEQICERVEVSVSTFFRYFDAKDAVVFAYLEDALEGLCAKLETLERRSEVVRELHQEMV